MCGAAGQPAAQHLQAGQRAELAHGWWQRATLQPAACQAQLAQGGQEGGAIGGAGGGRQAGRVAQVQVQASEVQAGPEVSGQTLHSALHLGLKMEGGRVGRAGRCREGW